jgi:gamma-glutamylcyclotransferase (GGCT)/AIG2-like uncharacterized protein YtfP
MHNLFVYGSLMFEPVWHQLLGRRHDSTTATLAGYQRLCIRGQSYPGIKPNPMTQVEGVLVFALRDDEVQRLDRFEGDEYQRDSVTVTTQDGSSHACDVYVIKPAWRHILLNKDWEPRQFEANALKHFLHDYRHW